jgi:hypothetical protein
MPQPARNRKIEAEFLLGAAVFRTNAQRAANMVSSRAFETRAGKTGGAKALAGSQGRAAKP